VNTASRPRDRGCLKNNRRTPRLRRGYFCELLSQLRALVSVRGPDGSTSSSDRAICESVIVGR